LNNAKEKKIIAVHGSYYGRNFGDTLILKIVADWVKDADPEMVVELPYVASDAEEIEILGVAKGFSGFSSLSGVIFGPGGYFGEPPKPFFQKLKWSAKCYKRHLSWLKRIHKYNIPYLIVGVGVGPISNVLLRRQVVKLFEGARLISVRDDVSKTFLVRWGVDPDRISVVPDVATTLRAASMGSQKSAKKIALHLPDVDQFVDSVNDVYEFVNDIADKYEIYIIEDGEGQLGNRNSGLLRALSERDYHLVYYEGPDKLLQKIEEMDVVLTTKLHVGIVGYALNKPVISIPMHTKTKRFYLQVGRNKYCVSPEKVSLNVLRGLFEECLTLKSFRNEIRDESLRNKLLVKQFIDGLDD